MVFTQMRTLVTKKNAVISITVEVQKILEDSGIQQGILTVEAPHSTVNIMTTSEHGFRVIEDLDDETRRLVPAKINYKHEESPMDAAGHMRCALFGTSVTMIVKDGHLVSEGKHGILYLDHDGPRTRKYYVCIIGE